MGPVTLGLCFLFLFDYVYILKPMSFPQNCDKKSEEVAMLQEKGNQEPPSPAWQAVSSPLSHQGSLG